MLSLMIPKTRIIGTRRVVVHSTNKEGTITMTTRVSKPFVLAAAFALTLFILACGFNVSTANIADAWMATDESGSTRATSYGPSDTFYAIVDLRNAPDTTNLKAVWIAVNVEGASANQVINETSGTMGSGLLHFKLTNDGFWPNGQYKVDIYLNDKLDKTVTFEVR